MSQASFDFITTAVETALLGIGLIGNLMTITIFLRKTFRNNSISTYCIALAIVELLNSTRFISDIYSLAYNVTLPDLSESLCKFFFSIAVFLSGYQPWIMVAFSVDKLLCMRTNTISILKKKWFQWSIVAGIILFHTALYMYIPILIKRGQIFPGYFMCDLATIGFFATHFLINLLETSFIPFLIMAITSIMTTRMLIKSRNAVMKAGQVSKERKSRDTKYAITSLSFNVLFITLKLPSSVFFIMYAFYSYFDLYFYKIAVSTFFLNSSLGFFIHLVTNSIFRREFLIIFGLEKKNNGTIVYDTTSRKNPPVRLNQVSSTT